MKDFIKEHKIAGLGLFFALVVVLIGASFVDVSNAPDNPPVLVGVSGGEGDDDMIGPPGWFWTNKASQEVGIATIQLEGIVIVQRNGQQSPEYIRKLLNAMLADADSFLNKAETALDNKETDTGIVNLQYALTSVKNFAWAIQGGIDRDSIKKNVPLQKVQEATKSAEDYIEKALSELYPTPE